MGAWFAELMESSRLAALTTLTEEQKKVATRKQSDYVVLTIKQAAKGWLFMRLDVRRGKRSMAENMIY